MSVDREDILRAVEIKVDFDRRLEAARWEGRLEGLKTASGTAVALFFASLTMLLDDGQSWFIATFNCVVSAAVWSLTLVAWLALREVRK